MLNRLLRFAGFGVAFAFLPVILFFLWEWVFQKESAAGSLNEINKRGDVLLIAVAIGAGALDEITGHWGKKPNAQILVVLAIVLAGFTACALYGMLLGGKPPDEGLLGRLTLALLAFILIAGTASAVISSIKLENGL
jgi:hypothetical protein